MACQLHSAAKEKKEGFRVAKEQREGFPEESQGTVASHCHPSHEAGAGASQGVAGPPLAGPAEGASYHPHPPKGPMQ